MSATITIRQPAVASTSYKPSAVYCGYLLLTARVALRMFGCSRTLRFIRRRVGRVSLLHSVDRAAIARVEHKVAVAAALYPGRAKCLEQSLVLFYLLRRKGIDVRLRLGAQPYPFAAHAWVEFEGAPINDVA